MTVQVSTGCRALAGDINDVERVSLEVPHHFGLDYLLNSDIWPAIDQAALDGRAVVMNSLLHDVADFGRFSEASMADVWKYYNASHCAECTLPLATQCKCSKEHAPKHYMQNIKHLGVLIQNTIREGQRRAVEPPKFYWTSMHIRPPLRSDRIYSWQSSDILTDLEEFAYLYLAEIGIPHIDFRPHTLSAPMQWWGDQVHYGGNYESFFLHMPAQIVLNHICR